MYYLVVSYQTVLAFSIRTLNLIMYSQECTIGLNYIDLTYNFLLLLSNTYFIPPTKFGIDIRHIINQGQTLNLFKQNKKKIIFY